MMTPDLTQLFSLAGKVALVTGGGSGIGQAIVRGSDHAHEALALELGAHRITVNAIAPGFIQTPGVQMRSGLIGNSEGESLEERQKEIRARVPLGRMGEPDDTARAALFLASAASDYITGSTLLVDGGYLLS